VDRTAPQSGTARSLIQTSAEALGFPAEIPKFPNLDPNLLRMPAAVSRRSVATSAYPRTRALPASGFDRGPVRVSGVRGACTGHQPNGHSD
jgi:hypothetical protein